MPGIMAALTTALPYISAAWQVGSSYLTKPKKEDYVPTGSMYNRYINYLKGQTTESRVYHQRMRPALRQISAQTQRGQRKVGYQVARDKPGGGIEAQMRMGINRQALEAIGIVSEKASIAQERVNIRTGEQLMRIGIQEERALQRYQMAKRDWTKDMFRTVGGVAINLANVAVQKHIADAKIAATAAKDATEAADAIRKAWENAKAVGDFVGTLNQFKEGMDIADYKDPTAMSKYLSTIRKQETKDIEIAGKKEVEKIEADSFEALRQFTEQLETLKDPKQAYAAFDEVKDNMILKDKHKALTKVESTFPDLVYDDPLERKIAVAETAGNIKAAEKNLAEAVETGTIDQITKAGDTINAITSRKIAAENYRYTQETRQTAADKKVYDAKILEQKLTNELDSTIAYLGIYHKTYSVPITEPTIGKAGETYEPLKKSLEKIELERTFKQLTKLLGGVTFKEGQGMSAAIAKGAKRLAAKYVSLIDIDSIEEKNLLKLAVSEFDEDEIRRLSVAFTGLDAKNAATFTLEIMKRIDALFNKMPTDDYSEILDSLY